MPLSRDETDVLLNDFAVRSFRDVADHDYIAARMAARARLIPQFLWSSLQAIEKYLKCILLLNRIKGRRVRHDLNTALRLIEEHARFKLLLKPRSVELIEHLDTYGRFRYLETPYHVKGLELIQLDLTVWSVRRYCRILDFEISWPAGGDRSKFEHRLRAIEASEAMPHRPFRLPGGALEKIIEDEEHPAREPLLWKNMFFGWRPRTRVRFSPSFHATNSPLSMHPQILDEVLKYVYLPKEVVDHYRQRVEQVEK
jgi:hypothetical protein